jgi:soluble lytic murein transglycosylase
LSKKEKNTKRLLTILIIIAIIVIAIISFNKQIMKIIYKKDYSEYVSKYAEKYGVEEDLIYALIKTESNFKPNAVSTSNAKGLMQLMYATAKEIAQKNQIELTEENILEPDININLGTIYIAELLEKYECKELALAAYNAGSGNVDKWIKNGVIKSDGSDIEKIPYKETNTYVRKIMRDYKIYLDIN